MDQLTQAFNFRHACKIFDETKKITADDINYILEAGRTSPSSFGLEPWHFLVISDDKLKEQLKPACFNQPQIGSCSHLVIVLYRKAMQFTLQSEYLRKAVERQLPAGSDATAVDAASQYFVNYTQNQLSNDISVDRWSEMQAYLPCANMMTAAAFKQIDSCAIGGFDYNKLTAELEKLIPSYNVNAYGVALCLAFGYRKNEQTPQIRWTKQEVVTFL